MQSQGIRLEIEVSIEKVNTRTQPRIESLTYQQTIYLIRFDIRDEHRLNGVCTEGIILNVQRFTNR
mgnify:CR=1 FL=1